MYCLSILQHLCSLVVQTSLIITDKCISYCYNQVSEYQFILLARDGGDPPRSATMETVVMVMDANDNAPRFDKRQYVFDVRENVANGTVIGQVTASDDDEVDNSVITYSFSRHSQVITQDCPLCALHTYY